MLPIMEGCGRGQGHMAPAVQRTLGAMAIGFPSYTVPSCLAVPGALS